MVAWNKSIKRVNLDNFLIVRMVADFIDRIPSLSVVDNTSWIDTLSIFVGKNFFYENFDLDFPQKTSSMIR